MKDVTYPGTTAKTVEYLYTGPVLDKVQDKAGSGTTIYATYSNYTSQGQAQTITYGNGVVTTSTFVHDGDGSRVKKIVGTTTTRYISKLYECDTTGTTTSCSRFIWANDTRVATVAVTSGTVHYWHGDHLGSSSVITDSTGAKVQALTYYPYGDILTNQSFTTPAVNVPYKFTGKELDASTNLYFYEARYYHAVFGRFIAPDTLVPDPRDPQSLNRYSYARNNPLIYTDPTGYTATAFDASEGFWPAGGMPQYDGLSLHSWRTTPDSFFTLGSYTLHGAYTPFDSSRSWGLDSFGGGRFGPSTLTVLGGWDSLHSASSDAVLMVPEVHVTGVRPMPSVPLSGWDWAQQGPLWTILNNSTFQAGLDILPLGAGLKVVGFAKSAKTIVENALRGRAAETRVLKELGLTKNTQKVTTGCADTYAID